jgi:hypothetical protein
MLTTTVMIDGFGHKRALTRTHKTTAQHNTAFCRERELHRRVNRPIETHALDTRMMIKRELGGYSEDVGVGGWLTPPEESPTVR